MTWHVGVPPGPSTITLTHRRNAWIAHSSHFEAMFGFAGRGLLNDTIPANQPTLLEHITFPDQA